MASAANAAMVATAVNGRDWIPVSCTYAPLKDNPGSLVIRFRREGSGKDVFCVRNLRVEAVEKMSMRNVPVVDAQLSRSTDGRRTAWFILNRSLSTQEVTIPAEGAESQAHAESLVGPSAYATNEETPDNVKIVPTAIRRDGDRFVMELPPHSATGITLTHPPSQHARGGRACSGNGLMQRHRQQDSECPSVSCSCATTQQ